MAELTNEQLADKNLVAGKLQTAITNFFGLTHNGDVSLTGITSLVNKKMGTVPFNQSPLINGKG